MDANRQPVIPAAVTVAALLLIFGLGGCDKAEPPDHFRVVELEGSPYERGYQHGARGTIGIIGHVCALPNEFFQPQTTEDRRKEIADQINLLSKQVKQGGAEVAAYKFALSLMGVIGDTVASNEADRELTEEQREKIRASNVELISSMSL